MKVLGILGGMGPLASAGFLDTLYRLNPIEPEQAAPICLLYSDPSFPDRTEAILAGRTGAMTARLSRALFQLLEMGADRLVVACVTLHHVFPDLDEPLRQRLISLVDLSLGEISRLRRVSLLLGTIGTRSGLLFEKSESWSEARNWIRCLEPDDQRTLHDWIYWIKGNHSIEPCLDWLEALREKYDAEGFLCGCTELHLVVKSIAMRKGAFDPRFVDPLLLVAQKLPDLLRPADERPTALHG